MVFNRLLTVMFKDLELPSTRSDTHSMAILAICYCLSGRYDFDFGFFARILRLGYTFGKQKEELVLVPEDLSSENESVCFKRWADGQEKGAVQQNMYQCGLGRKQNSPRGSCAMRDYEDLSVGLSWS